MKGGCQGLSIFSVTSRVHTATPAPGFPLPAFGGTSFAGTTVRTLGPARQSKDPGGMFERQRRGLEAKQLVIIERAWSHLLAVCASTLGECPRRLPGMSEAKAFASRLNVN